MYDGERHTRTVTHTDRQTHTQTDTRRMMAQAALAQHRAAKILLYCRPIVSSVSVILHLIMQSINPRIIGKIKHKNLKADAEYLLRL